jgi:hypothetical protein
VPQPENGAGGPQGTPCTPPNELDLELAPQRNPVHELLDSLVGIEVDGGCPDCLAYQTIERVAGGVYVNRIFHDDTCPWWIRYQAATR